MGLHAAVHLVVVEITTIVNEGLAYLIQCSIVEVLGLEGSSIDHSKSWVLAADDVLLN